MNRKIKHYLTIFLSALIITFSISPGLVFADEGDPLVWDGNSFQAPSEDGISNLGVIETNSESTVVATATNTHITEFITIVRDLINWMTGIVLLVIVGVVIYNGVALANAGANPSQRREVITRLVYCGIAAMITGSLWTIASLAAQFVL